VNVIHLLGGQKLHECYLCGGWFKYELMCGGSCKECCTTALRKHVLEDTKQQLRNCEDLLQVTREERDDLQVSCEEALTSERVAHEALIQARKDLTMWRSHFDRASLNNHILEVHLHAAQHTICKMRDALK